MNKLLYILLLSFFTLSAIGGKQERDTCGKEFALTKRQTRKSEEEKNRQWVTAVDQNWRQRGSSSKDSAAFKAMVINARYVKRLNRFFNDRKYKEGLELTERLIKEGEGTPFIARWKEAFRIQLIQEEQSNTGEYSYQQ